MAVESTPTRLKKELGLWDVYAVGTGATLSSGFFLLPGLAAVGAGPALPLTYLVAGLFLIPGLLAKAELATAMPRAGGEYYYLDRSLGPLVGTMGGFGTWIALMLKSAFALVGIGAYLGLFIPGIPLVPLAAAFAILFGSVNLLGAKKSTSFQVVLLIGLLLLLGWFTGVGALQVRAENFTNFFASGPSGIIGTAGLVIVSYMGLTKIASIAEDVKNPERNLPLAMFLAFGTVLTIYVVGTAVMVGVVSADTLARNGGDLTPVATVATVLVGPFGGFMMTVAAVLAFSSVANTGILSASRYPLAMSRDDLLPKALQRLGSRGTPRNAIYLTVAIILLIVIALDPTKIAKLAGAFMLVMFALNCLAVIVMRESQIESYDPNFRSPFYPVLPIVGILAPFWLVVQMGWLPTLFTFGLMTFGALWYSFYGRRRVSREGAIYHVFERLGRQRDIGLNREFRQILKEKGLRSQDRFDEVITMAAVLEAPAGATFDDMVWEAARKLAEDLPVTSKRLGYGFVQGTSLGMTPVSKGAALPHLRLKGIDRAYLALVRSRDGLHVMGPDDDLPLDTIHAVFFLVSPEDDPGRHLRVLAQLAGRVDSPGFIEHWLAASDAEALKTALVNQHLPDDPVSESTGTE